MLYNSRVLYCTTTKHKVSNPLVLDVGKPAMQTPQVMSSALRRSAHMLLGRAPAPSPVPALAQVRNLSMHNSGRERTDRRRDRVREATEEERVANQAAVAALVDGHGGAGQLRTGRAWRADELRLKSFEDLQKLWFVLLRERNILLSERAWCKMNGRYWENGQSNLYKVKRSMARLQCVVGERVRAYKARRALNDAKSIGKEGLKMFKDGDSDSYADDSATMNF